MKQNYSVKICTSLGALQFPMIKTNINGQVITGKPYTRIVRTAVIINRLNTALHHACLSRERKERS